MKSKVCNTCNKELLISEFFKVKRSKDGYGYKCKTCKARSSNKIEKPCDWCAKVTFQEPNRIKSYKHHYCSRKCKGAHHGHMFKEANNPAFVDSYIPCDTCGMTFKKKPAKIKSNDNHYCSRDCANIGFGKFKSGPNNPMWSRIKSKCSNCNKPIDVSRKRLADHRNHYCSPKCSNSHNVMKGYAHPRWNPNLTETDRVRNRDYAEYIEWRKKVFVRDSHTCQSCGSKKSGNLQAHHILNYSEHPSLRLALVNGICLCKSCHKGFHDTFGYTGNNAKQLLQFLGHLPINTDNIFQLLEFLGF